MAQNRILIVTLAAALSACSSTTLAPPNAVNFSTTQTEGTRAVAPRHFSFEVTPYKVASASDVDTVSVDGQTSQYRFGQVILALDEGDDVGEISAEIGGAVIEQETIPGPPTVVGKKEDGTYRQIPSATFKKMPNYLLKVEVADSENSDELPRLAEKMKLKGHYKFSSKKSAAFFTKALKIREKLESKGKKVYLNDLNSVDTSTTEGALLTAPAGSFETSPNNDGFWWTGPWWFGSYYGCNMADPSGDDVWQHADVSSNVKVAVIDKGFQGLNEPYMPVEVIRRGEWTWNFQTNKQSLAGSPNNEPGKEWHGRWVSSLIFGHVNDAAGTLGAHHETVPILLHAMDTWQQGSAIDTARSWGAKVINMSYGQTYAWNEADYSHNAIMNAYNANVILIAATGNNGNQPYFYPAAYTQVMGVCGYDKNGSRPSWMNATNADLYAPGVDIPVATNPGQNVYRHQRLSGTSLASPIVAGIAAIAFERGLIYSTSSAISHFRNRAIDYSHLGSGKALNALNSVQ